MTIVPNIVATYVSPEGVARVAKRALCGGVRIAVHAGDRVVLRVGDVDGVGGLMVVKMVKYMANG